MGCSLCRNTSAELVLTNAVVWHVVHRRLSSDQPMSTSGAPPSPADRLVAACYNGDLLAAEAAIADGAAVNEKGKPPSYIRGWSSTWLPLKAAVVNDHLDVVVWLLSHGGDPNGDAVMSCAARDSTTDILQLLIDAGGDVNRRSDRELPLFAALYGQREDNFPVLLAQPSLDLTVTNDGRTPEQYAFTYGSFDLVMDVWREVSYGWVRGLE